MPPQSLGGGWGIWVESWGGFGVWEGVGKGGSGSWEFWVGCWGAECTKIVRFSAVAAAIFTAPPQNRAIFKAPRCAISSAKKIASERRFSLRLKGKI